MTTETGPEVSAGTRDGGGHQLRRPADSPDPGLVGAAFPDLTLPDSDGIPRTLSALADGDPLVLQTFRGPWCPKEQTWFRELLPLQDEADVAYTRMVSLSVDQPEVLASLRDGLGARWTFLSDAERRYVDVLGLRETTDSTHRPYAPYAFVLLPDLTVSAAWNGYWYWGRPTRQELWLALREATRRVRSDWVVPGEAGDRAS
jgi:peroxiredoxin